MTQTSLPSVAMRDRPLIEGVIGNLACFREASSPGLAAVAKQSWLLAGRRGDALARKGQRLEGVFTLAYGSVKLALGGPDKHERVLRIVSAGEIFGQAPALLGRACPYDVVALAELKLVVMPSAAVFALMDRDARFARSLVKLLAEGNFELLAEVEASAMQSGAQRLAAYLLSLEQAGGAGGAATIRLPAAKSVVAARLGVKKETLSRLLRSLELKRLIEVAGREIRLLDRRGLTSLR